MPLTPGIRKSETTRSTVFSRPWAMAAAGCWRYGLKTHMVTLGITPLNETLPAKNTSNKQQTVIFIDHAEQLWDPKNREQFMVLVDYCYNSLTPLWINLAMLKNEYKPTNQWSAKFSEIRTRNPIEHLPEKTRVRLYKTCTGWNTLESRYKKQKEHSLNAPNQTI